MRECLLSLATSLLLTATSTCRNPYSATESNDQLPISANIDNKALHEVSLGYCIFIADD